MPITVAEAGSLGGKARAKRLSPERRKEIAQLASKRAKEIREANAKGLVRLNERDEGVK